MHTYCTTAMRIDPKDGDVLSLPGELDDQYFERSCSCVYRIILSVRVSLCVIYCILIPAAKFEPTSLLESLLGNYCNVSFAFHLIYFLFG